MAASCYWRKELLGKLGIPDIIISLSETCNVIVLLGGDCAAHCVGSLLIRKTSRSVHRPRAGTLAVLKQLQTQLSCHSRSVKLHYNPGAGSVPIPVSAYPSHTQSTAHARQAQMPPEHVVHFGHSSGPRSATLTEKLRGFKEDNQIHRCHQARRPRTIEGIKKKILHLQPRPEPDLNQRVSVVIVPNTLFALLVEERIQNSTDQPEPAIPI